jgi:signal transduction histidine kinase
MTMIAGRFDDTDVSGRGRLMAARPSLALRWRMVGRGLLAWLHSLVEFVVAMVVLVVATLVLFGVGVFMLPSSVSALRSVADRVRRWSADWSGVPIGAPYSAEPLTAHGFGAQLRRDVEILTDRSTWRDLGWATVDVMTGALVALVPATAVAYGVFGAVVQPFVWRSINDAGGNNWYTFIRVDSGLTAGLAIPVGVAIAAAGVWFAPYLVGKYAGFARSLLAPTRAAALARRVERLADTRADATDTQAAELRRIERDLHDGAQARLVALGMSLGSAEELLDRDPDAARRLVVSAREASSMALQELRDLVRGVHPPVLADRGIADAVRALALDSLLDVTVTAELPGRPAAPVESAAYFAISEMLTNASKHADASTVAVTLTYDDGSLHLVVLDDGHGGADPAGGSGIRGIERRLATFDGTLSVDSPAGGPTTITMEIPCALSSPRTSSS